MKQLYLKKRWNELEKFIGVFELFRRDGCYRKQWCDGVQVIESIGDRRHGRNATGDNSCSSRGAVSQRSPGHTHALAPKSAGGATWSWASRLRLLGRWYRRAHVCLPNDGQCCGR